jgi:hypothetical protein
VLEAVTPLVRNFPLSKLLPFYWIPLEAPWSKEAEEFALDKIGDPYSEGQAVAAFLGRLRIDADRAWECAEYSHAIAGRDGIDLGKRAVPTDLVREAMRRPGVAKIYVEA